VVNEALQFGMPAIVSDRVGCRHDLIVEGETGFIFPVRNAQALTDRMFRALELMTVKRELVKEACRQKARDYSLDCAVAGILAALA
jgi:glycosyltransferase involved in cell wall biosynthesis